MWQTDLTKGVCALVTVSIEHEDSAPMGGVRGIVLESHYLLEPCGSGKSRLTHICRKDLKYVLIISALSEKMVHLL